MQVFKLMVDVIFCMLVGVVVVCRVIYIEDLVFKNKVIENKFFVQIILNFKFFCGKYFDIFYVSVESMCDVKEIQYLRGLKQRDGLVFSFVRKRKRDDLVGILELKEQQLFFVKKGKFVVEKN